MARLSAKRRRRLKPSQFGLADAEKYPVNDPRHAILAKGRAAEEEAKGNLSAGQEAMIDRRANAELRRSGYGVDTEGHAHRGR